MAGLLAVILPASVSMVAFLHVSWIVGLPAGFILYLVLDRLMNRRFRLKPQAAS